MFTIQVFASYCRLPTIVVFQRGRPSGDCVVNKFQKRKILIVDDVPVNIKVLAEAFKMDYQIRFATNGEDALKIARSENPPDLILLDIMIPAMDGYEVCEHLKRDPETRDIPIIFITAKTLEEDEARGLAVGAVDYITKPISIPIVKARVKTHLELKARNEELQTLDEIVRNINREIAMEKVLQTVLEQGLILYPQAERGSFLIWDPQKKHFYFAASAGFDINLTRNTFFVREDLAQLYLDAAERLDTSAFRFRGTPPGLHEKIEGLQKSSAMLATTVELDKRLWGILVLENLTREDAFDNTDVRSLGRFRDHIATAVVKARFLKELNEKNMALLVTQKHLMIQEKMASLGTLSGGIAHEIKNPLNFVNNFSGLCLELGAELAENLEDYRGKTLSDDAINVIQEPLEEMRQNLEIIHKHGKRADEIVKNMMAYVRNEAGERQKVNFNGLIEEYTRLAAHGKKATYSTMDVNIVRHFDQEIGRVELIPQDISRVVINLINNALDSIWHRKQRIGNDYQPEIQLVTQNLEHSVTLTIRDNGEGIPHEHWDHIFTPFFTTRAPGQGNSGLGLYITYEIIVQEHMGEITFNSKEDEFTEFIITIPKSSSP